MTDAFLPNMLAWFEVATDDPDTASSFYGDLFGWTFSPFADPETTGSDYRVARRCQAARSRSAASWGRAGRCPATPCSTSPSPMSLPRATAAERFGGKVVSKELAPPAGPPFAYLRDPVGSLFGVFTPTA